MELASLALPCGLWDLQHYKAIIAHPGQTSKPAWEMEVQEGDWFLKSHSKSGARRADPERVGLDSCWGKRPENQMSGFPV